MDTTQLDYLILQNLGDLDSAAKRIEQINDRVWREAGEHVKRWAKNKNWQSAADDSDIWVAPRDWIADDDQPVGRFDLGWGADDQEGDAPTDPYFNLSRMAGQAGGQLCLWFTTPSIGNRVWKREARVSMDSIGQAGFTLTDKLNPYLVCTLSWKQVAEGLADDNLDEAFSPIIDALEQAYKARDVFNAVLVAASAA